MNMGNMKDIKRISDPEREMYLNQQKRQRRSYAQLKELRSLFNRKNRKILIETLFQDDVKAFNQFLERLNQKTHWTESFSFVREELMRRKINVCQYESILLMDLLYRFYYPEEI
jgi:hypothetical protein